MVKQPLAQRRLSRRAPRGLGSDRADRYGTAVTNALLSSVSGQLNSGPRAKNVAALADESEACVGL